VKEVGGIRARVDTTTLALPILNGTSSKARFEAELRAALRITTLQVKIGCERDPTLRPNLVCDPETIEGLMCRHQSSIDPHGRLYDCDFNRRWACERRAWRGVSRGTTR
jgi:hypothetical protein